MEGPALAWAALAGGNLLLAAVAAAGWWRERRRNRRLGRSLERASTQIDTLVTHDGLTGLRGRPEFDLAIEQAVLRCDNGGPGFSILYVDLDNLHVVNETLGHPAGDQVLREAAQRLPGAGQIASRIAGDEFAILVTGDRAAALREAQAVAQRLSRPFTVDGQVARLACSIGIAGYPHHGARPTLVGQAMAAMRHVKATGGAAFAEYTPQMGEQQREQAELLRDLRLAVERGTDFELYYQPKVDARSLQVTAAEALVRWRHPVRGIVAPGVFIPLAERHGLIGPLGDWVIREACRQAAAWRRLGMRMRVAVNLSGAQLRQGDLVARIESALSAHQIPAGRFTCEVTETVAMEDTEAAHQAFERLRAAGVHVSIDDFGTGHSSLALLRRLPAAELKIDRAFVADLETSEDARAIVSAIVQMAHTLDLHVVAEGVETEGQRDWLVQAGCDELQGYLFAHPMTATALALWAAGERRLPDRHGDFRASIFQETQPLDL